MVAKNQISDEIYNQLRVIARHKLGNQRHTNLNTTILVHEAYIKMLGAEGDERRRASFYALASKTMRNLLVDYVRERNALKRGGGVAFITLESDLDLGIEGRQIDILAIEKALLALEQVDPHLVEVVECRFFAGMDYEDIAAIYKVSERTIRREWRRARAFLGTQLNESK